eukprot:GHVL01032265.1.p1 GENE.GHVL01032265.1~~GHVL01032265.1.p1  ORF type:complete len:165 (-),score=10.44 GHVL01032265.1:9-503(-)
MNLLIHTRAARSLCSSAVASQLNLVPNGQVRQFKGLGLVKGEQTKSAIVQIGSKSIKVRFWVVNVDIPILLAQKDSAKLDVYISTSSGKLVEKKNAHVTLNAVEENSITSQPFIEYPKEKACDTEQTIRGDITDVETKLKGSLTHLSSIEQEQVIEVFNKHHQL